MLREAVNQGAHLYWIPLAPNTGLITPVWLRSLSTDRLFLAGDPRSLREWESERAREREVRRVQSQVLTGFTLRPRSRMEQWHSKPSDWQGLKPVSHSEIKACVPVSQESSRRPSDEQSALLTYICSLHNVYTGSRHDQAAGMIRHQAWSDDKEPALESSIHIHIEIAARPGLLKPSDLKHKHHLSI